MFKHFLSCILAFASGVLNFKAAIRAPLSVFMGTVPGVPGSPDYTRSGSANIPELFSRTYRKKQYDTVLAANITNTDHTGELKSMGDTVIINTVPDVTVGDYTKGKKREWEACSSDPIIMRVNKASDFAVVRDDVDQAQFWDKDFLSKLGADAAKKINIKIDTGLLGTVYADAGAANQGIAAGAKTGFYNLGSAAAPLGLSKTNILDVIHNRLQSVAGEANWDNEDCFLAMPTWMKGLINISDYKDESMTGMPSTFKGGKFGKIGMFQTYQTNLYTSFAGGGKTVFPVLFGSKSAIAFVSQLNKTQYFPNLEATSGSGLAGINLYDWKVINPELLGVLHCYYIAD